ncbi:hypothetical protein HBI56_138120 [Parastagonospora nodorum]|nr:hypothetical protein HBI13_128290 [Parastagonospora nodorum]KAH4394484.1 hypothetical protein HBH99_135580 [Parastagonospora nodorum]KAH6509039.1 hypothetical protein HBI56_138120 [Parastagonospora nodorum]
MSIRKNRIVGGIPSWGDRNHLQSHTSHNHYSIDRKSIPNKSFHFPLRHNVHWCSRWSALVAQMTSNR